MCNTTKFVLPLVCVSFIKKNSHKNGSHNVSRWMTWLPISLKNAAKCDKWYQLQNHSITESLNANGAREKPYTAIPVHAVSLSVEQKPNLTEEPWLVEDLSRSAAAEWLPRIQRQTVGSWVIHFHCERRSPRWRSSLARACAFFNKCKKLV